MTRGFVKGQEDSGPGRQTQPDEPHAQDRAGRDKGLGIPGRGTSVKSPVPNCTPDLVGDQKLRYDALCAALPPIDAYRTDASIEIYSAFWDELVCVDLEWDENTGELKTIGVGNERRVIQIDWRVLSEFDKSEVRDDIKRLTEQSPVVYHSAWSDLRKLRENGFKVHPKDHFQLEDTMLAHAVLHSEEEHTLEFLVEKYGKLPQHKDFRKVPGAESVYNAADVVETVLVWKHGLLPELRKDPAAENVYREMSLAYLCEIQVEQEEAGIRVDKTKPYRLRDKYVEKIDQAAKLAIAVTGWPINLKAPDDVKQQLYGIDGLPLQFEKMPARTTRPRAKTYADYLALREAHASWKKTKLGPAPPEPVSVTTDKDAIATLRRLHGTEWDPEEEPTLEAARAAIDAGGHPVLEARYLMMGAQQALSHYVMPCFEVDAKGEILGVKDRIYPECRIHVQSTGRHSFVGPAVQQMRGDVAELLTPDVGTVWIGWDWSQIEVRLLAVLANDEPYLAAFARGDDIHELNARAIFGPKGGAELEAIRRRFIKAFVFRLHYRGKPENAGDIPGAKALGLDAPKLVRASESYLGEHPAIPEFWAKIEAIADKYGVVYSFMGRPRRLTSEFRAARLREACNDPMQAGVSDIYIETALMVKRAAPWARMVFGAHDAQTWQVPAERDAEFRAIAEPIVHRPFRINGRDVIFPAEFKPTKHAAGDAAGHSQDEEGR